MDHNKIKMLPSYYFNAKALHKHRAKYLAADLGTLYALYTQVSFTPEGQTHSLMYRDYKTAWKELNFGTIHYAIMPDENIREFYELLYGCALGIFFIAPLSLRASEPFGGPRRPSTKIDPAGIYHIRPLHRLLLVQHPTAQ